MMSNMKLMKKFYTMAAVAVLAMIGTSCSLEEDTSSISTPDNFFRNYTECQSVVI